MTPPRQRTSNGALAAAAWPFRSVTLYKVLNTEATERLLFFHKIMGGSDADDVVLRDLSNIADYNTPQSAPLALALDASGNGYEIDNVLAKGAGIFSGFLGQSRASSARRMSPAR